jgi:hypothetical protein
MNKHTNTSNGSISYTNRINFHQFCYLVTIDCKKKLTYGVCRDCGHFDQPLVLDIFHSLYPNQVATEIHNDHLSKEKITQGYVGSNLPNMQNMIL